MRCIRQVNKNYFPFLHNFIEIIMLAFWGFVGRKSRAILMKMNVDINNWESPRAHVAKFYGQLRLICSV